MNIEDVMVEDIHGIMGSEPEPVDITGQTKYVLETRHKLQAYLYASMNHPQRRGPDGVNFLDEIERLREWWIQGFAFHNKRNLDSFPCNFNDVLSHLYIQLGYIQCHRHYSKVLEFEKRWTVSSQGEYNYTLIVDACCALASLAGCKHYHLMKDPELQRSTPSSFSSFSSSSHVPLTLGQLELQHKLIEQERIEKEKQQVQYSMDIDHSLPLPFPSLQDLETLIVDHHLGFINLWYYYRHAKNEETQSCEWEIRMKLTEYIRSLQIRYHTQIEGQRERQRLLSLEEEKGGEEREEEQKGEDDPIPKEWLPPSPRWKKERGWHTYMMAEEQPVYDGCYYWYRTPLSYVDRFVVLQTHVFAQVEMEHLLFNKYPQYKFDRWQRNPARSSVLFQEWVKVQTSKLDPDGFVKVFKQLVFEHILPLGGRTISTRTKDNYKEPDIVFKDMIGHRATMYMASLLEDHPSRSHIANTLTHPLYPYLVLSVLHFSLKQQGQALSNFIQDCIVPSSKLLLVSKERGEEDRFARTTQHGITRVPLLILLTGKYCIHSMYNQEEEEEGQEIGTGYWYVCDNVIEWVLTWFSLCYLQYPSLGFPIGRSFKHWLKQFRMLV